MYSLPLITHEVVPPWSAGLGALVAHVFVTGSYSKVSPETVSMPLPE
jgi:hypothetical protein